MKISSHYQQEEARNFLKLKETPNISSLIYRDIPALLGEYDVKGKALDFGCGPGLSTRFFKSLGFEITGVDINKNMLIEALSEPDGTTFAWIQHGKIPFNDKSFDLVTSIMVLLELPNLQLVREAVDEIHRVLKPGGIFLAIVGSENFPKYNWRNKKTVMPENPENLKTEDEFHTYSKTTGITFKDYYYTEENYRSVFTTCGFRVLKKHEALGSDKDNVPWDLERHLNPFSHYICQKI